MFVVHHFVFGRIALYAVFFMMPVLASAQSFKDVSVKHPAYSAVEYLKTMGIVSGYSDGTFRPDTPVNRAEALKLILAPIVPESGLATYKKSPFADVAEGAWFLPYVEAGRSLLGIISGPPQKTHFFPSQTVMRAEFLKMFLLAQRIDVANSYGDLKDSLSTDVPASEWHFPYMRYALATSMIMVDEQGNLNPGKALTRGDIALMMYHAAMYEQKKRLQALLSVADSDIANAAAMIEGDQVEQAEFASARAIVASRGALTKSPDHAIVKGAVKTAESFRLLVRAYRAGKDQRLDEAITLAGDAWNTATRIVELAPSLSDVATQIKSLATQLANSARAAKG